MKALNDIIIVKRRKANTVIELVGHKEHIGEVIAVGPGKLVESGGKQILIKNTLKEGEHIMFSHRAGMETDVEGEEVLIMRESDVLCVVDPEEIAITDNAADETRDVVGEFNIGGV